VDWQWEWKSSEWGFPQGLKEIGVPRLEDETPPREYSVKGGEETRWRGRKRKTFMPERRKTVLKRSRGSEGIGKGER